MSDGAPPAIDDWERELRAALAGSSLDEPRPQIRFDLPRQAEKLLEAEWLTGELRRAAVLVPVIARPAGASVLLTRRSDLLRQHKGQVAFPGGRRDDTDRDAVHTALREAQEEIGLPPEAVEIIGFLDDLPTITRFRVTPVVGLIRELPPLRADAGEVAAIFEVPLVKLLDPASYQRKQLLRGKIELPFYELEHDGQRVWGATAAMLWNLRAKVEERR